MAWKAGKKDILFDDILDRMSLQVASRILAHILWTSKT